MNVIELELDTQPFKLKETSVGNLKELVLRIKSKLYLKKIKKEFGTVYKQNTYLEVSLTLPMFSSLKALLEESF